MPWRAMNFSQAVSPVDLRRTVVCMIAIWLCYRVYVQKKSIPWSTTELTIIGKTLFHGTCLLAAVSVVLHTYAFRFALFDVGIFHQIIASFVRDGSFFTSISGSGGHFNDHFSPSLALLAPAFWLTGSAPWILPLCHVALMWLGGLAWLKMAKSVDDASGHLVLAVSLFFCTFDSLWLNVWWGFHETAISFAAWSWFFAIRSTSPYSTKRNIYLTLILVVGACAKETSLVEATCLCLVSCFFDFRDRHRKTAGWWLLIAVVLVAALLKFESLPKPGDKNYFIRYYGYLGFNTKDAVFNLLKNPLKPFQVIGETEILKFIWTLLFPWLGLPIVVLFYHNFRASRLWLWFIAFLPSMGLLALATYPDLRGAKFHYVIAIWPIMAFVTINAFKTPRVRKLIWLWVFINAFYQGKDVWENSRLALSDMVTYGFDDQVFRGIPLDAKISADQRAGTWIANLPFVTRWDDLSFYQDRCPDIVLIHDEHPIETHRCLEPSRVVKTERFKPWTRFTINPN